MNISAFIKENKIKGAVFDMDGTLTDSMERWGEIYSKLCRYLNIVLPQDFIMKVNHVPMRERVKIIVAEFNLKTNADEVYDSWVKYAAKYYESIFKIKPYMLEILKKLNTLGIKSAIATASDKVCADTFIKSNNLTEYINCITALDEVNRSKNFPDIYLKTAKKLELQPCECVVFEDALTAIKAAKSGGFKVCGVQDNYSKVDEKEIKEISNFVIGF